MRKPDSIKIGDVTLQEIIDNHQHWLKRDCDGWEGMRANLYNTNLIDVNLNAVNLSYANLELVNLCNANLNDTNLTGAYLRDVTLCDARLYAANLYSADLNEANLVGADLRYASLINANLYNAFLSSANLKGADLRSANLEHAYLYSANLTEAKLHNANLYNTNLTEANLCGAIMKGAKGKLMEYRKGKILTEPIIGYKKCVDDIIVTLEIPRGSIVFSINGDKCRTNKARVINIDRTEVAYSIFNNMSYHIGDEFTINNFNLEYNKECSAGIHFFMTREDAINYSCI